MTMSALARLGLNKAHCEEYQYSKDQEQTQQTFSFKWSKRETYESDAMKKKAAQWLVERYLDNEPDRLEAILGNDRKIILDAGCGSGFSALLFFGDKLLGHDYLGVDISNAIEEGRARFSEYNYPGEFFQGDLMQLPIADETVDIIFSEGVLHHTDSTEQAIKSLTNKLKKHGKFLFYVYRKKAVIREFTDDYIRNQLAAMTDEQAWEALLSLTKLGAALGQLNIDLTVEEDIPFLGIQKGKLEIQRFFYWNICKLFYRKEFSLDEMNHINFDWFRPFNCHRHTPEEIQQWCKEANLRIEHLNVQEAGITVVATKI